MTVSSPVSITTLNNNGIINLNGSSLSSYSISFTDGSMIYCHEQSSISSSFISGKGKSWSNCSITANTIQGEDFYFALENTIIDIPMVIGTNISLNRSHVTICESSNSSLTLIESGISQCQSGSHIYQSNILFDHCNDVVLGQFEALSSLIVINGTTLRLDEDSIVNRSYVSISNSQVTVFYSAQSFASSEVHSENVTINLPRRAVISFLNSTTFFQGAKHEGLGSLEFSLSTLISDGTTVDWNCNTLLKKCDLFNISLSLQKAITMESCQLVNSIMKVNDKLYLAGDIQQTNSTITAISLNAFCQGECNINCDDNSIVFIEGESTMEGNWKIDSLKNNGVIQIKKSSIVFNNVLNNGTLIGGEESTFSFKKVTFSDKSVLSGGNVSFLKDTLIKGSLYHLNIFVNNIALTAVSALQTENINTISWNSQFILQNDVSVHGFFHLQGDIQVNCENNMLFQCNNNATIAFNQTSGTITGDCFGTQNPCKFSLDNSSIMSSGTKQHIYSVFMNNSSLSSRRNKGSSLLQIESVQSKGNSTVRNCFISQVIANSGVLTCEETAITNSVSINTEAEMNLLSSELDSYCTTQGNGILRVSSSTLGGMIYTHVLTSGTVSMKNNTYLSHIVSDHTIIQGNNEISNVTFGEMSMSDVSFGNLIIHVERAASLSNFINCTDASIHLEKNSKTAFSDSNVMCKSGECTLLNYGNTQTTVSTLFNGFHTSFIESLAVTGTLLFQSSFSSGSISLVNNSQIIMDFFQSDGDILITGPGNILCQHCQLSGTLSNVSVVLNDSLSVFTVDTTLIIDNRSTFFFEGGTLEGKSSSSTLAVNGTLSGVSKNPNHTVTFLNIHIDSSGCMLWNNSQVVSQQSTITNRNTLTFEQMDMKSSSFPTTTNTGKMIFHHNCFTRAILENNGSMEFQGNNSLLNVNQFSGSFFLNGSTTLKNGPFTGGTIKGNGALSFDGFVSFSGSSVISPGGEESYGVFDFTFLRLSSKAFFEIGGYERGKDADFILSRGACHIPARIEVSFMSFVPNIGDEFVLIQCLGDVTGKPKAFFSGIDPDAATLEIRNNSVIVVITGCQKPPLNVSNCTECQPGYLLHENNVTCSPCSQGFISSTNNSRSCDVCPRDSIQPEPGQTSCQPCPNGTTTNDHITCLPINTASIVDLSSSSKSPKVVTWVIPVIFFGILLLFILFTRRRKEKKEIVVTLEQEPDELDQHDEPLLLIPPVFPDFPVCLSLSLFALSFIFVFTFALF